MVDRDAPWSPAKPRKCTWYLGIDMSTCPHFRYERKPVPKIAASVLDLVGNTPLVKLNKIPQSCGVRCDVLAKCECYEPGGSVKDRLGYGIIKQAEHQGLIKQGVTTIIVPTSGNSGIGHALTCAVLGYPCLIVMSEKFSMEKQYVLEALGAKVIRTSVLDGSFSPNGIFGTSYRLCAEMGQAWVADQYTFPANPMMHYDVTAEELLDQCDGQIDMYVASVGTGGTLGGVAQKLKEKCPTCKIVGADPWGSKIARPQSRNECDVKYFEVEGIGYEFEPATLDYNMIDEFQKVGDQEGHLMARRIIREEGILCGASSGTCLVAALNAAKSLGPGQKCVFVVPDNIRNYLSKFVDDHWMELKGFQKPINVNNHWWWEKSYECLGLKKPLVGTPDMTVHKIFHLMSKGETDAIVIVDEKCSIVGVAEQPVLIKKLIKGDIEENHQIKFSMNTLYPKAPPDATLGLISRILEVSSYVVICKDLGDCIKLKAVAKPMDVLHFTSTRGSVCS